MPVRKTESRLPPNFQAADFGQTVVASDGRCALVSFVTSPIVIDHENVYVVFVTDTALAAAAHSFEWTFTEGGNEPKVKTTQAGELSYRPRETGILEVTVRILGPSNSERAKLFLTQDVVPPNPMLEALVASAGEAPGPGLANPDVIRELVNNYSAYYQDVALNTAEPGDGFQQFLFSMAFDGTLQRTAAERKQHIDKLAGSLNGQDGDFATLAAQGVGVCAIRLPLLAMTFQRASPNAAPFLEWTELPESSPRRAFADEQLRRKVASMDEAVLIDLFNLARFPKSNITQCGRILEALRDRYFAGTNFNDVLAGLAGTRAHRIVQHYQQGPLMRV